MRCPPYVLSMRITDDERRKIRLWLPLFVLWPLLSFFLALTLIVALLADAVGGASGRKPGYTRLLFACLRVIGETKGTEVLIQAKGRGNRTVALTVH